MLIDAHAHIDKYGKELSAALTEIAEHRILTIATAMDIPSYERLRLIADRSDLIVPTFGVHPKRAPEYAGRLPELSRYIEMSPAIGEIGLDFYWVKDGSAYPAQLKVLEYFLAAAREQKKFVNLHTKGAEKQILELLERYDVKRAIVHWYSGPLDILHALAQFGACFTVGVEVLCSDAIREIAREIPARLLLTETDNPGGLNWLTGAMGMPQDLVKVVNAVAGLRNSSSESIMRTVHENFSRMIEDDPWLGDVRELLARQEI